MSTDAKTLAERFDMLGDLYNTIKSAEVSVLLCQEKKLDMSYIARTKDKLIQALNTIKKIEELDL